MRTNEKLRGLNKAWETKKEDLLMMAGHYGLTAMTEAQST
jgi:hypothetical protein